MRNDQRSLDYYRSAYEAEKWLIDNNYGNNAGQCLIRDYEVFLDRNCTVPAISIDEEIKAALDVANTIATHATGRCGVIGHLFPFPTPFGKVECNEVYFDLSIYEDFQCQNQE